jgi:hypothetical protein
MKIVHHKGGHPHKPEFEITHQSDLQIFTSNDEKCATLASGDLNVRINQGEDWLVEFTGSDLSMILVVASRFNSLHSMMAILRKWRSQL